jgi:hypothetical protein
MTRRALPGVGLWLLERLGRGYHGESLIGDLIERCAQGRSTWWAWREIITAIFIAQARRWRPSAGSWMARAFWWCVTELAVMLSIILIADQSRDSHGLKDMVAPVFLSMLMVLVSVAIIGLNSLIRLCRRQRGRAAVHHLLALFVVMTLGVGTLTWAATVHHENGRADAPRFHDRQPADVRHTPGQSGT